MSLRLKLSVMIIVLGFLLTALIVLFSYRLSENFFRKRVIKELSTKAGEIEFLITSLPHWEYDELKKYSEISGVRLTLIQSDGTVIFESNVPESELKYIENHLDRPEVKLAIATGEGVEQRFSTTLNKSMLYYAKRYDVSADKNKQNKNLAVIRVSMPISDLEEKLIWFKSRIFIFGAGIVLVMIIASILLSRNFTNPVSEILNVVEKVKSGKLHYRIEIKQRNELGKLAESINNMIDKLNEDIVKLQKLEMVRRQFLGNVSHELRTPIFALQSAIETLLNGAIDDKNVNRDFLKKALNNAQRLDRLLSDLIDISRIESGEMKMNFVDFNLNEFLNEVTNDFSDEAKLNEISLALSPVDENIIVIGDRERLKQVMANLLSNAIKNTPQGGSVSVYTQVENSLVHIFVKDTGCGIPPQHLDRIFERFYRIDENRSRKVGGTGLGLAIVKHIVEAHQSKVRVESEVNKGSIFSFSLKIFERS